ncbi:MAG: EAL domain-containing protein [Arcobacteraceae bacterium]|nr:EAL domain-containing protein [Arcobacteraceae bacterium]
MKLLNHTFMNIDILETYIQNHIHSYNSLLIQIFSGTDNTNLIQTILDSLHTNLPNAKIIGASTAGEIINGIMSQDSIVISFSMFDNTKPEVYHFEKCDFVSGEKVAQDIIQPNTKAIIAFAESLQGDAESFLEGFSSINQDIIISGGNAADNNQFKQVYIIKDNQIFHSGIVLVLLNSDTLQVSNNYIQEWTPIGKEMTITKATNNIVYEIDGIAAIEIYRQYLGEDTVEHIPSSAIEFPFLKVVDGINVARAIVAQGDNGSLVYAGHFNVGDKVRFSIGNLEEIINQAPVLQNAIASNPVEATYIYSCTVRKLFLKENLNYEFGLIEDIAPSVGFFTYGEFFHSETKQQLLNITTTTLSLSECDKTNKILHTKTYQSKHSTLKALTHLVNSTQNELDGNINFLNQYKMVLDINSIVSKTDKKGIITYVNDEFCRVSGYSKEELLGHNHNILRHPDNSREFFTQMWDTIKNKQTWRGTFKNLAKNKTEYYVKSVIIPILDENENIVEYIASRIDVTELVQKDKIIKEQFHDDLTGLENRVALLSKLKDSIEHHTLILINIDRFSDINNYFGYEIGDKVLKLFSKKLTTKVKNGDIHRISGDEFAILYKNQNYEHHNLQKNIIDMVNKLENYQINVDGINTSISFACGVAYGQSDILYKLSHMALKASKTQNQNIAFYNQENLQTNNIKNNIETINEIQSAIEDDRIVPFFQGIVDNDTQRIVKYESLIRMIDKNGKVISPFFFLDHAKKAKLYDKLTQIMIKKTIETFAHNDFEFSINFTLQDILSKDTKKVLFDTLKTYNCGDRLVIEIVESEGINNFSEVISFITDIKKLGCKIAIDDFGTGYSNFEYLINLKANYLKIDGSLIKNIDKDENSYMVVSTIVEFAKKLDLKVIAEFVENETIFYIINSLGIEYSQGYYFSIPKNKL